jgi:glycosyltransferase involved in cell wall biosynthesis
VSIVIPTYRRPDLLRRCLEALLRQEYPVERLEVVVVEDDGPGSAERVVNELRDAGATVALRYAWVAPSGPGAARNVGWRQARGEVIAFTDDDTVPDSLWIREGVRAIQAGADAVAGRTIVPLSERPTDAERNTQGLERATFATCNAFCRRDWLERVGGFDPRFRRAYREDSDLEYALLDAGARVVQHDAAVVIHPPRAERPWVSLKQQRNQMYDALLYRKHPGWFRARIRKRPPWRHYAIALAQVGSLAALLRGHPGQAGVLTAVWTGLAGRFFVERARGTSQSTGHLVELAATSALIPPIAVYWRLRGAWVFRVPFL